MSAEFTSGDQSDYDNIICPYCGYAVRAEAEDNEETPRFEDCSECGKEFVVWAEISVTYHTAKAHL